MRKPIQYGEEAYEELLIPIAQKLMEDHVHYPMTLIFFTKLQHCGLAYRVFERVIRERQYVGDTVKPSHRLFNQYHNPQTKRMKADIISEIVKVDSNIRVVFATSSLGMGVDIPSVKQIIHLEPPSSLEAYMQQVGRGGRNSEENVKAVLYYNNSDISKNVKHMTDEMRKYCLMGTDTNEPQCLRAYLIRHFNFEVNKQNICCSNCDERNVSLDESFAELAVDDRKKVRSAAMNLPRFIQDVRSILQKWSPSDADALLYEIPEFPTTLPKDIADDVQYVDNPNYLLRFGIWDEKLAESIYNCILEQTYAL